MFRVLLRHATITLQHNAAHSSIERERVRVPLKDQKKSDGTEILGKLRQANEREREKKKIKQTNDKEEMKDKTM